MNALTTTETALNGKVQALLLDQIARGTQLGTQVSVYRNGEQIRVYTRWFMDWAARNNYTPLPLAVASY